MNQQPTNLKDNHTGLLGRSHNISSSSVNYIMYNPCFCDIYQSLVNFFFLQKVLLKRKEELSSEMHRREKAKGKKCITNSRSSFIHAKEDVMIILLSCM